MVSLRFLLPSLLFFSSSLPATHNKIDDANSFDDIRAILRAADKRFEHFIFYGEISSIDDTCGSSRGIPLPQAWMKADVDGNGYTDIIISGTYSLDRDILCILDRGNNDFYVKFVTREAFGNCCSIKMLRSSPQPAFVYYHTKYLLANKKTNLLYKDSLLTDTLVYRFGDFVEINSHIPVYHHIEKISISTSGCFGTCPVFSLDIDSGRKATYHAGMYNKRKGNFSGKIKNSDYEQLTALLDYIDFPSLENGYAVNWTDDQSVTLTITYDNGKVKTIEDYGLIGTFGLNRVYNMLYGFRENQNWK
ncbi:MAG TPA: DUF6438 domain-containing protein [Bacteroidia bacterium]